MLLKYDDIKKSLSREQRAYLESAPQNQRRTKRKSNDPNPAPNLAPQRSAWRNCENGCMGSMHGVRACDVCGGRMVQGRSDGRAK